MFQSVSSCTPNSRVTVSFVATKDELLVIDSPDFSISVLVYVNVSQVVTQPIAIKVGDTVQIELDAPAAGLHRFINYSLGGIEHSFAVVSKDDYRPTVKPNDAPRRWFNYFPKSIRTTFYTDFESQIDRPLGRTLNFIDIDRAHVVLDHIRDRVNFYYFNRELITSVKLPSGPVEYTKSTYADENGDTRVELLVLCVNKVLYRIRFNNRFSASGEFFPTVTFIRSLEQIWYEADLPTGESFIDARRNDLRQRINPPMTALDVNGSLIWAAGYDTVYIMDKNFLVLRTVLIETETIVNIACFDGANAYAITRTGKIWRITSSGLFNLVYTSNSPLGAPARFQPPGEAECILVPDPNNRRLLKITGPIPPVIADSWDLGDFAPAYARTFNGELWVTGHDTNRVLRIKSRTDIQEYSFKEKVTIVSVEYYGSTPSILAVHYLKNYITLDLTGIRRTVPITLDTVRGPMSHIGTRPYKLVLLGAEGMPVYGAPGVTCWVNGIDKEQATTGDHFSVSYKAQSEGLHSVAFVLGNRGYDFKVEVLSNADKADYFVPSVTAINRLDYANANVIYYPTFGSVQSGTTAIPLDFKINFFGSYYTQVNVGTNGYITFGNEIPMVVANSIGSLGVDAIYVETGSNFGDLLQELPKSNQTGITTTKPLPSGRTPGVYYNSDVQGDDRYLRIAWVGCGDELYPDGNDIPIVTTISNSYRLPVEFNNLVKAKIGDYVVGNSITSTTSVVSKLSTPIRKFEVYKASGSDLFVYSYTDSVTQVDQYSEVVGANRYVLANSKSTVSSTLPDGTNKNTVLLSEPSSIIVNGNVNPIVGTNHSVVVPVLAPATTIYKTDVVVFDVYEDSVTVLSNVANVTANVGNAVITSARSFLVSNTDAVYFYVGQEVLTSNISKFTNPTPWPTVVSKNANEDGTYITITSDNTLETGDVVTVKRTEIIFSTVDLTLAGRVRIGGEITYELSKLTLNASAPGLINQSIDVQGHYIVLDKQVGGFVGTNYNFKTETPVKEYTYEVGFYSGKRFQYVEVFYDNTNHQSSNITAITSRAVARGNVLTTTANVSAGSSFVFASEIGTGNWANIGVGSFDFSTTKTSLKPKFVQVPAYTQNDSNIEFLIDQEFTTNSNVLISSTFGQLTVNGGFYSGRNFIKQNDIVRLSVPFNKSIRAVAPIISIGDYQYPVPMIASAAANLLVQHTFITNEYPTNSIFEYTFTIPAADNYYISDYYRSTSGVVDYTYKSVTAGITANLFAGNIYSLTPTSQLTIKGFISSSAIYDNKEIILIGERNSITVGVKTTGPGLVNYLNFGNVDKPFTNNVEYIALPGNLIQINDDVGYTSSNLVLTSSANISTANLYINDLGTSFIYNGSVANTRWATNLTINSNISLKRDFIDYFQGDATVYQVYYDSYAVSNVYIPVGSWNVINQTITGAEYSKHFEFSGTPLTNYSIPNGSVVIPDVIVQPLKLNPFVFVSDTIRPLKDYAYQFTTLTSENSKFVQPSYLNVGKERTVLPDTTRPAHITLRTQPLVSDRYTNIFTKQVNSEFTRQTDIYIGRVTVNPDDIQYRYILVGGAVSKYVPTVEIKIGSIVGTGIDLSSYFEVSSAVGEWLPAATEDKDSFIWENETIATSTIVDSMDWFNNERTTLRTILNTWLAEDTFSYRVFQQAFDKDNLITILSQQNPGLLERRNQDDMKWAQLPAQPDPIVYARTSRELDLIQTFSYWWFNWTNDMPSAISEMPGQVFSTVPLPRSEFNTVNDFRFEVQTEEAYTQMLAKYETAITEFSLRNYQTFGKKFTEIVFNYGQLVDDFYTELVFDVLKSEMEDYGTDLVFDNIKPYTNRAEEALVPAPGYINYKPIDKLLMFFAPYIIFNGAYEEVKKFLPPIKEETNITKIAFDYEVDQAPILLLDLIPIFKLSTMLKVDLIPMEDKIPITLIDLPPQLDQIPLIFHKIEFMLDIIPDLLLPLEYALLKDEVWEMDEITIYGTYSTTIKTLVDQGQHSDWWNLKRVPNDVTLYSRPFDLIKLYTKEYNYLPGGFLDDGAAEDEKVKYYNSVILPIPGTSYWNYRIYFKQRHFCVPKKGIIFPTTWLTRGG